MDWLHRHRLVRLGAAGWARLLAHQREHAQRDCLELWAKRRLPLVVATQHRPPPAPIEVGLAAPLRWGRVRIALDVEAEDVEAGAQFPLLGDVVDLLPGAAGAWASLTRRLDGIAPVTRVYGSFGWQRLTGLDYVHERSDLDLLLPARDAGAADAVAATLLGFGGVAPRLDGEIVFADGSGVAWREWARWRSGAVARVVVKRLHGAALESDARWLAAALAPAPEAVP